jgi:hypothetical protein
MIKLAINILSKLSKIKSINKILPVFVGTPVIIQNSKKEILLGKRNKNMPTYPNTWDFQAD